MKKNNQKTILIISAVVLLFLFSGLGSMMGFGNYTGMYGMMNGFYGGFGFMWVFGTLFMILILVALTLFIIWLIKQIQNTR